MAQKSKLAKKISDQVKHYLQILKSKKIAVDQAIVFGSYAKGTQHEWSDIDLCIISSKFGHNNFDELIMLSKLRDDDSLDIEVHPMDPQRFASKYDTLAHEIRTHGISIHV